MSRGQISTLGYRLYILDVDSDTNVHMGLLIISDMVLDDLIQLLMTAPGTERGRILDSIPFSEW